MTTTTISLERSAYELLRSKKRPHESFSEELHRLLGAATPDLKGFLEILSAEDGPIVADAIEAIRLQDIDRERGKARGGKRRRGRRA